MTNLLIGTCNLVFTNRALVVINFCRDSKKIADVTLFVSLSILGQKLVTTISSVSFLSRQQKLARLILKLAVVNLLLISQKITEIICATNLLIRQQKIVTTISELSITNLLRLYQKIVPLLLPTNCLNPEQKIASTNLQLRHVNLLVDLKKIIALNLGLVRLGLSNRFKKLVAIKSEIRPINLTLVPQKLKEIQQNA